MWIVLYLGSPGWSYRCLPFAEMAIMAFQLLKISKKKDFFFFLSFPKNLPVKILAVQPPACSAHWQNVFSAFICCLYRHECVLDRDEAPNEPTNEYPVRICVLHSANMVFSVKRLRGQQGYRKAFKKRIFPSLYSDWPNVIHFPFVTWHLAHVLSQKLTGRKTHVLSPMKNDGSTNHKSHSLENHFSDILQKAILCI